MKKRRLDLSAAVQGATALNTTAHAAAAATPAAVADSTADAAVLFSAKETHLSAKETHLSAKETHLSAHEPLLSANKPHFSAKEPDCFAKVFKFSDEKPDPSANEKTFFLTEAAAEAVQGSGATADVATEEVECEDEASYEYRTPYVISFFFTLRFFI